VIEFDFNLDDITDTVTVTNYVNLIWTLSAITVLLYEYKLCRHILLLFFISYLYLALSTSPSITLSIPFVNTITTFTLSFILSFLSFVHGATSMLYHVDRGIQSFLTFIRYMHFFTALYTILYNITTHI